MIDGLWITLEMLKLIAEIERDTGENRSTIKARLTELVEAGHLL